MDCSHARALLLEADLAELDAGRETELGRHLASCATCRAAALAIRAGEARLAARLEAAHPRGDASTAVSLARVSARRRARAPRLGIAGAALAAAALAGVLVLPRGRLPGHALSPLPPPGPTFSVTAPPGREVIVLHTANPKIVVVWFLPTRRTS
jgi:anti-sigma factor RsiW